MSVRISLGPPVQRKEKEMAIIQVKAAQGRVAYDAPRGGKIIPQDKFVPVVDSPWIRRLANVHKDVIIEGGDVAPAATPPAPPPSE